MGRRRVADRLGAAAAAIATTWSNGDLARAQLSFAAAWTAEWAFTVAISVYAFRHGGASAVGVISLLRMAPAAFAVPALTPLADRWRADRMLATASGARAVVVAAAAVLVATTDATAVVYILTVAASIASTLFRPVHSALLPTLCRSPYELTSANIVRGLLDSVATLVGPALAALLLAHGGVSAVLVFTAASSAASAALMLTLRPEPRARPAAGTTRTPLSEGLRTVRRSLDLGILIGLTSLQALTRGAASVFVVVLAISVLGTGEPGVGALTAAIGVGAVLGSVGATLLVGTRRLARWFGVGVALWGLPIALLAGSQTQIAALGLLAVVGIANALVDVGVFTLIARRATADVLAAAYGVLESGGALGVAVGSLLAPLAIDLVGVRKALVVIGLLTPVAVAAAWRRLVALDRSVLPQNHEIDVLRAVQAFALLPLPAVEQLARSLTPVTVSAGDAVFSQGDIGDSYFVVETGEAEVMGGDTVVATLGPGEGFGDIALLRRVPRTATVRARTELHLMALSGDRFLAVLTSYRQSGSVASAEVEALLQRYAPR